MPRPPRHRRAPAPSPPAALSPDPIQEVLRRLRRVRATAPDGAGWEARCPAHDDDTPSLSVTRGRDGRVLLHCHAGCDTAEVVRAMGLTWADLFPEPLQRGGGSRTLREASAPESAPAPSRTPSEVEAAYPYHDEEGRVLFRAVRLRRGAGGKKRFVQQRPDGEGGWANGVRGIRRVLYRLPEVKRAVAEGTPVLYVEGEKDAETALRLARAAPVPFEPTTSPMGAGKWLKAYARDLAGAVVWVLPDRDEAGRKHAEHVAASLRGVAKAVKVVDLPGLPERGDLTDWVEGGGGALELVELVARTPYFYRRSDGEADGEAATGAAGGQTGYAGDGAPGEVAQAEALAELPPGPPEPPPKDGDLLQAALEALRPGPTSPEPATPVGDAAALQRARAERASGEREERAPRPVAEASAPSEAPGRGSGSAGSGEPPREARPPETGLEEDPSPPLPDATPAADRCRPGKPRRGSDDLGGLEEAGRSGGVAESGPGGGRGASGVPDPSRAPAPEAAVQREADVLYGLLRSRGVRAFRDGRGGGYAEAPAAGADAGWAYGLGDRDLRLRLAASYFEATGRILSPGALEAVLLLLESQARFGEETRPVATRMAFAGGAVYLDLGDEERTVIEVSSCGWTPRASAPATFVRTAGMAALPRPVRGGSLELLREGLGLAADAAWTTLRGWLVASLLPFGPVPPLLVAGADPLRVAELALALTHLLDPHAALAVRREGEPPSPTRFVRLVDLGGRLPERRLLLEALGRGPSDGAGERLVVTGASGLPLSEEVRGRLLVARPRWEAGGRAPLRGRSGSPLEAVHASVLGAVLDAAVEALRGYGRARVPGRLAGTPLEPLVRWVSAAETALDGAAAPFADVLTQGRRSAGRPGGVWGRLRR